MKNFNKKVFLLTFISFCLFLVGSIVYKALDLHWEPLNRTNLIADILKSPPSEKANADSEIQKNAIAKQDTLSSDTLASVKTDFNLYKKANYITDFHTGDSHALPNFEKKLFQLKKGEKVKIRIAYFGDSMIEGDLLTQTFRALLQKEYGGYGVGFLPIKSNVSGFRQSATAGATGWSEINFITKNAKNLYLSGHEFFGPGTGYYKDNTFTVASGRSIEKALLYGKGNSESLTANGTSIPLLESNLVNREVLSKDSSNSIKIASSAQQTPIYGVSFESEYGIVVDNFSFRGITGVELGKISEDFMKSIQEANHYDLIILQYGVNLLFRPKETNFKYYSDLFNPVLKKMKSAFCDADFLIISTADRAFRYHGEYKSALGIQQLIKLQAQMAHENKMAFYNQFATMGGEGSIVEWANAKPPLANKDYIHPNHRGAAILGEKLFNAIKADYSRYEKNQTSKE